MENQLLFRILLWAACLLGFAYIVLIVDAVKIIANKIRTLLLRRQVHLPYRPILHGN